MEHYPVLWPELAAEARAANASAVAGGAAGGGAKFCAARCAGARALQQAAGFVVDSDGKLAPLGPRVEFKLIDYGIAAFNEELAQLAGGHAPAATLAGIQQSFAERGIVLGAEGARRTVAMDAPGDVPAAARMGGWALKPSGQSNRLLVEPAADAPGRRRHHLRRRAASVFRWHREGPVERAYRHFWSRKGDVFHLLLALALALDDRCARRGARRFARPPAPTSGRHRPPVTNPPPPSARSVWPREDARDVQLFVSLVHHVTGAKMRAHFVAAGDDAAGKLVGKRRKVSAGRAQLWAPADAQLKTDPAHAPPLPRRARPRARSAPRSSTARACAASRRSAARTCCLPRT
jgi:hypothetical protein